MKRQQLALAILAGGEGRRIGGGKPVVELGSQTLLERAVERAAGWTDTVSIVLRSRDQTATGGLPQLVDRQDIEGPLGGLAAALAWANAVGAEFLLTIPCDMPFFPFDLWPRLLDDIGEASAAIAASDGRLHPVCGLWRSDLAGLMEDYASTGRRSLKGFAEMVGFTQVDWVADPFDPFFNINSPSDLQSARSILGPRNRSPPPCHLRSILVRRPVVGSVRKLQQASAERSNPGSREAPRQ
ncbi:molybdenum cofactor guanylyltransferase [Sphingomonas sp. HDW15A]|nr:molybdenum cofactor guanylyltransferase [Sphingomonas sp. HDW15A]